MFTVERLLRVTRGEESVNSTVERPLDHLVACHGRIEERLAVLERAAAALESQPDEALPAIAACFRYFDSSGVLHTADEEESVFPRLRPLLPAEELAAVERLEAQHREAEEIYAGMKAIAARLAADPRAHAADFRAAVERFAALYRPHIEFENRELIAAGRRLLSEEQLGTISEEMKSRRGLGH